MHIYVRAVNETDYISDKIVAIFIFKRFQCYSCDNIHIIFTVLFIVLLSITNDAHQF